MRNLLPLILVGK